MRVSDSNPIQFWPTGKPTFNETIIAYIDKKIFHPVLKFSDIFRVDVKFDRAIALTYSSATIYETGNIVYSSFTGLRYKSIADTNINHDPAIFTTGAYWVLEKDRPVWSITGVYNSSDEVRKNVGSNTFVFRSLTDLNIGNDPWASSSTFPNIVGVYWALVIEDSGVNRLAGYIDDVLWNSFPFTNIVGTNQKSTFDLAIYPELIDHLLGLKITGTTLNPFIQPCNNWPKIDNSPPPFTSSTATQFSQNISTGVTLIQAYEPMYVLNGKKITVKYTVQITGGPFVGNVAVAFLATDSANTEVGTKTFNIPTTLTALGTYDIVETITLTGDCERLQVNLSANLSSGSATVVIKNIVGDNVVDTSSVLAQSDCIEVATDFVDMFGADRTVLIEYSNQNNFDDIIYNVAPRPVNKLRVFGWFYNEDDPQEEEDYDDSKGNIVTLRNKIRHKRQLQLLRHLPAYMHRKIRKILMHDFIRINGVIYKREDDYQLSPVDTSTLFSASVWLTEQGSVLVNVGGEITTAEGIFDDTFDETFN